MQLQIIFFLALITKTETGNMFVFHETCLCFSEETPVDMGFDKKKRLTHKEPFK